MPNQDDHDTITLVRPKAEPKVAKPKMWAIYFRNDDFTPIEFVVQMMAKHINMDIDTAVRLTIQAHEQGGIRVGRFTLDVAETKASEINKEARANGHPLQVEPTEAD